jgi:hypothetical protein
MSVVRQCCCPFQTALTGLSKSANARHHRAACTLRASTLSAPWDAFAGTGAALAERPAVRRLAPSALSAPKKKRQIAAAHAVRRPGGQSRFRLFLYADRTPRHPASGPITD